MSEDKMGARGNWLFYSKPVHGYIHKDDDKERKEFKNNCSRKNIHMNYDGKKRRCGWLVLLKRNNRIEKVLIPFALASGIDADIFIDEVIDEFLENIKIECTKNDLAEKVGSFRKDTISKVVSKIKETA